MYKVFFKDRIVYIGDDFSKAFEKNKGLFYRHGSTLALHKLVDSFYSMDQVSNLYLFHEDLTRLTEKFKAFFTLLEAGGGVVLNRDGDFLAIQRNGVWDLPKGKLKKGEDFQSAALREVEEETGLQQLHLGSHIISTFHTYKLKGQGILKKTSWFEMNYSGADKPVLQAEEGITNYRWVPPGATDFIRKNTYLSILDVLSAGKFL